MVIASTDNARDLEDGELLLGREDVTDGDAAPSTATVRYVVETLLIPTQHAPRNTCMADEENDMLRLTEERGFITLGWAVFRLLAYARELPPHGRSEVCPFASFLLRFLPFLSSLPSPTPPLFVCFTSGFLSLLCSSIIISGASVYSAHRPVTSNTPPSMLFHPHPDVLAYTVRRRRGPSMSGCAMPYATRRRCRRQIVGSRGESGRVRPDSDPTR
ncbi:hypothetical protein B0H14DRAFT_2859993 [Mycena olivaceomarginata]|nr:hypothetical protein B0H14DRAFT_2859993 [Mycena olivaceomarginata]